MKKLFAMILALAMVFALASCGVSTEDGSASTSSDTSSTAAESESTETSTDSTGTDAAASTGKTIRLFNGKIEIDTALQHLAQVYEEETGVHVEVESLGGGVDLQATLKQYYQAGNMPDIFIGEGATDFDNWTGLTVDMSDQAWTQDTEAEYIDEAGDTIGFPYTTEAIGMAYNADILEAAGVDPSTLTSPEAYEEAFALIDSKKDELGITAVVGYCAEASSLYWSTAQHVFGNYLDAGLDRDDTTYIDLLNDGGQYDKDRLTAFAEFVGMLNEYSDPALLVSGTYDQQVQNFAAGKYAFVTQGSWIGASMTSSYADDYAAAGNFACGFAPYAFLDGIDTILTNSPSWWAVYDGDNVAEAEAFLQWVSEDDGQQIMVQEAGCVSPFASCTYVANDPFAQAISDYTAAGKTSSWHWLEQPGNLAQDYTGILFQDYANGKFDAAGFVDALIQVTPNCYQ
jgi:raffinose/stachyose/melibiose transport system substrate-binding protein